jgi:hypothetical protein
MSYCYTYYDLFKVGENDYRLGYEYKLDDYTSLKMPMYQVGPGIGPGIDAGVMAMESFRPLPFDPKYPTTGPVFQPYGSGAEFVRVFRNLSGKVPCVAEAVREVHTVCQTWTMNFGSVDGEAEVWEKCDNFVITPPQGDTVLPLIDAIVPLEAKYRTWHRHQGANGTEVLDSPKELEGRQFWIAKMLYSICRGIFDTGANGWAHNGTLLVPLDEQVDC